MGIRVGIELSPAACRLVELEGLDVVPGRSPATRVRSYSVLPRSGPETDERFASIGRVPVAVVVWGARSDHRQVVVSNGSYERMRAEALAAARDAGVDTRGMLADIAPASTAVKGASRQPVMLALAHAGDVSAATRPLIEARVRIRSIVTPADALLGLARSRQAFAVPGAIEAYVALDATVTCVALVRDGALLSARELSWGYEDGVGRSAVPPQGTEAFGRREDLAARLVDELAGFLTAIGAESNAVAQISICGGVGDLRTMTVPLMERLDIEVEALDSLFGIDAEHLPAPADAFRERAAELRLAWSAAADWRGPINLMRHRRRRSRRIALARAAVVAGVAAGLGAGWAIERSQWWQSTAPELSARRTSPGGLPSSSAPARANAAPRAATPVAVSRPALATPPVRTVPPPVMTPPSPAATPPAPPAPAAVAARQPVVTSPAAASAPPVTRTAAPTPPVARVAPPVVAPAPVAARPSPAPPPVTRVTPPVVTPAPASVVTRPLPAPPVPRATVPVAVAASAPPAVAPTRPTPAVRVAPEGPIGVAAGSTSEAPAGTATPVTPAGQPASAASSPLAAPVMRPSLAAEGTERVPAKGAAAVTRRAPEPPPVPFEAVLGTILYSPDRKLAIVNGRIVGQGDEVNGATIVDITPTMVLLRDGRGRLRSLTLGV